MKSRSAGRKPYLIVYSRNLGGEHPKSNDVIQGDHSLETLIEVLRAGNVSSGKCKIIYIHLRDFDNPRFTRPAGGKTKSWDEITSACRELNISLVCFTSDARFEFLIAPDGSRVPVFGWPSIEPHLGYPSDPSHQIPTPADYLDALYIFCQGYISVHAEYEGPKTEWQAADMEQSLSIMDWQVARKNPQLAAYLPRLGATKHLKEVRSVSWWQQAFPNDLSKTIKREWQESEYGSVPEAVDKLAKFIEGSNPQIIHPKIVADAFCAIAQRLAG